MIHFNFNKQVKGRRVVGAWSWILDFGHWRSLEKEKGGTTTMILISLSKFIILIFSFFISEDQNI
jgi:hypothetical protein